MLRQIQKLRIRPPYKAKYSYLKHWNTKSMMELASDDITSVELAEKTQKGTCGQRLSSGRNLRKYGKRCCIVCFCCIFVIYTLPLFLFFVSHSIREGFVFGFIRTYSDNLTDTKSSMLNLSCVKDFRIPVDTGSEIGAWYIPARNLPCRNELSINEFIKMNAQHSLTVLHYHGQAMDRGFWRRLIGYRVYAEVLHMNVLVIDYRDFGDSSSTELSVATFESDALSAYLFLSGLIPSSKIVLWGHSLGTSAAISVAAQVSLDTPFELPAIVIIESGFDEIGLIMDDHFVGSLYRGMPFFESLRDTINNDDHFNFNNTHQVQYIDPSLPVLLLHATRDPVISVKRAQRLKNEIAKSRLDFPNAGLVELVEVDIFSHRVTHVTEYPDLLRSFISRARPNLRKFLNSSVAFSIE